jgi:hypothetical protein
MEEEEEESVCTGVVVLVYCAVLHAAVLDWMQRAFQLAKTRLIF